MPRPELQPRIHESKSRALYLIPYVLYSFLSDFQPLFSAESSVGEEKNHEHFRPSVESLTGESWGLGICIFQTTMCFILG